MGGRGTDDDDTHERHTDTNKLTRSACQAAGCLNAYWMYRLFTPAIHTCQAAGCLNGWWMYKIVGMALRATERRQPSVPPTPQSLGGSAQRVRAAPRGARSNRQRPFLTVLFFSLSPQVSKAAAAKSE